MSERPRDPILIGYDGYDDAAAAIRRAGPLLAPRRAIVACVWDSFAAVLLHSDVARLTGAMKEAAEEFDVGEKKRAGELAEQGARLASEVGFEAEPVAVLAKPKAWSTLLRLADEHQVAAIVVGSEGFGAVKSALLGSVSSALLHHSHRPVLVVPRAAADEADGPVMLAYDGSGDARRAIAVAGALMPGREAIVHTVWTSYETVVATGAMGTPLPIAASGAEHIDQEIAAGTQRTAEEGARLAAEAGLQARAEALRAEGNVTRTLLERARVEHAAAIVAGSRGRSGIESALLGSVSAGLVHHAPTPILVVPAPA